MPKLAHGPRSSQPAASAPGVDQELAALAERMRGAITPVVGYLELMSQDGGSLPPDRYLHWIATIERRLDLMRETCDRISLICEVLKEGVNDREVSPPPGPEALAG